MIGHPFLILEGYVDLIVAIKGIHKGVDLVIQCSVHQLIDP